MLTEERFAKILSILESMGSVTVQQLMTELDASESTIRRDLNALDANGQLTKVHGGAILKTVAYSTKDDNVISRKEKNRDAKNKIAKYAAEQIASGDFVYLDAGTTTELMIEYITSRQAVFVTNAISHAKRLAERGFTVYLLGGEFKAVTEAIVGEEAAPEVPARPGHDDRPGEHSGGHGFPADRPSEQRQASGTTTSRNFSSPI